MKEQDDSYLEQRIAEETAKIKVGSYQKTASLGGWAGGGRTLWAISAIGAAAGIAIGAVAPFFPLIVGASTLATAVAALPASMAIMGGVGMSMGFGGGLVLGRISGSAAAVAEENEMRMKHWTTKQMLQANPQAHIVEDNEDTKKVSEYKPFWHNPKATYKTYVNPRVGMFFTLVGAIGGLLMGAAFIASGGAAGAVAPALGAITGLGAAAMSNSVIMATSVGILAAFGALFSLNLPKITSDLTELSGKFTMGEKLGRGWGPEEAAPKKGLSYSRDNAVKAAEHSLAARLKDELDKKAMAKATSYQDMVRQSDSDNELTRR